MPPFNKEVQGNDFGFFMKKQVWWQEQGEIIFGTKYPAAFQGWKKRQRWRPPINAEIPMPPPEPALSACHDIQPKYAYEKRFDHVKQVCMHSSGETNWQPRKRKKCISYLLIFRSIGFTSIFLCVTSNIFLLNFNQMNSFLYGKFI